MSTIAPPKPPIDHNALPQDMNAFFMPFTPQRQYKQDPRMIVSARGMVYTDSRGHETLDCSAGLWCVNAGHYRTHINEAIATQLEQLDFAHNFNSGHPLVFDYAERLTKHVPDPLNHVFFTNSGSESVDTALKIALAYQRVRGEGTRQRLIGREFAYHGMGFGGLSVAGLVKNRQAFGLLLPGTAPSEVPTASKAIVFRADSHRRGRSSPMTLNDSSTFTEQTPLQQ